MTLHYVTCTICGSDFAAEGCGPAHTRCKACISYTPVKMEEQTQGKEYSAAHRRKVLTAMRGGMKSQAAAKHFKTSFDTVYRWGVIDGCIKQRKSTKEKERQ